MALGDQIPNDRRDLAAGLDNVTPFFVFPPDHQARDLHDKRHRELEHAIAQDNQDARPLPTDEATIKLIWLALRNVLAKSVRATFDGEAAMNQFATCSANGLLRRGVRAYPTTPILPSVQLIPYRPHERLHHAGAKQARARRQLTLSHHCALAHHSCTLAPPAG